MIIGIANHIKLWNEWRKRNLNGKFYKFLVLLKLANSPTFEAYKSGLKLKTFGERYLTMGNNTCNLTTCRYNKSGACENEDKRKECVEVSKRVLRLEDGENERK